jgi:hypothetical protein
MTQWENIIFAAPLMEIGDKANDAKKSTRLYGKFKNKGKWIYWTKTKVESLPESHAKHFTE